MANLQPSGKSRASQKSRVIKKQFSIAIPAADFRRLRRHADRTGITISDLVRHGIKPLLDQLKQDESNTS